MVQATHSTLTGENLQELLDSTTSAGKLKRTGAAQYFTPDWFANFLNGMLCQVGGYFSAIDLQAGTRNLLTSCRNRYFASQFGVEIDRRLALDTTVKSGIVSSYHITGNCVRFYEIWRELFPDLSFAYGVVNPPFSIQLKTDTGSMDSTMWTWNAIRMVSAAGYMIANRSTIEKLGIHQSDNAYLYTTYPVGIFPDANVAVGVVHFNVSHVGGPKVVHFSASDSPGLMTEAHAAGLREYIDKLYFSAKVTCSVIAKLSDAFGKVKAIMREESKPQSPFNIWIRGGKIQTYLSTREKLKLSTRDIERLSQVAGSHPLALTPEKETRDLLQSLIESGIYTIEPDAVTAIKEALHHASVAAVPIMPVTDFQRVAYCDQEEELTAITDTEIKVGVGENDDGRYFDARIGKWYFVCQRNQAGEWWGHVMKDGELEGKCELVADRHDAEDWVRTKVRRLTPALTGGKRYAISTSTYEFNHCFIRKKLHFSQNSGNTYARDHDIKLSGQDRYIEFRDDNGRTFRFMDRPTDVESNTITELSDMQLWDFFRKPHVDTVAEVYRDKFEHNKKTLKFIEAMAGFSYYEGQFPYIARVGCLNYGLIAAETGCGKTLIAISLFLLKSPRRALIVAPQGTTRSQKDDDEDGPSEMTASQWILELRRYAIGTPVFELFSYDDYERILNANNGNLPHGIYISYYEAMFSNRSRESISKSYNDKKLLRDASIPVPDSMKPTSTVLCEGIGKEVNGIRCIVKPTLATLIGHEFDFVGYDEAHKMQHLSSNVTQQAIRMQPRYRFAFTATPIPNLVSDLFPMAGWICVPEWYKGGVRNVAWPYAREDGGRFCKTFLSTERDLTQEAINAEFEDLKEKVVKVSPVVSSPARLLKIITPWLAYISKKDCNPNLPPVHIHDVRVPMGSMQAGLYAHYMERGNIPAKNAMEAAAKQITILRAVTADPAATDWNNVNHLRVTSNFNPKASAILGLIANVVAKGEQAVVVCARCGQSAYLERRLTMAGVAVSRIDSSRLPSAHTAEASRFKAGKTRVLIMGIKCAQAHSFVQCRNLIIGSLEYSYGTFEQAIGRIYRVTTPAAVNVWCVLNQNTIEEVMFDTVANKGDAASICLRGQRVPRDYKPTDIGEILAVNYEKLRKKNAGVTPHETLIEEEWPEIQSRLQLACKPACNAALVTA